MQKNTLPESGRMPYVDAAKAVGILLVIVGHCGNLEAVPYLGKAIYTFHMPLFFVISGMFVKRLAFGDAVKKHAKAYLWPYAVTCVLVSVWPIFTRTILHDDSLLVVVKDRVVRSLWGSGWDGGEALFATIPMIGAIWFLLALFFSCTIYACLKQHCRPLQRLMAVLLLYSFGVISAQHVRLPFSLQAGLCALIFVWFGDELRQRRLLTQLQGVNKALLLAFLCIWIVNLLFLPWIGMVVANMGYNIIGILAAIVATVAVILLCKRLHWSGGWMGRNTLYILSAHVITLQMQIPSVVRAKLYAPSSSLANFALNVVVNVSAVLLLAYVLQRFNILKWPFGHHRRATA